MRWVRVSPAAPGRAFHRSGQATQYPSDAQAPTRADEKQREGLIVEISGIISALVIGVVIGLLGRLVLPGRQHIGVLWTIVVGIAAALLGTVLARAMGIADTGGVDWIEWAVQIALAALGVAALSRVQGLR